MPTLILRAQLEGNSAISNLIGRTTPFKKCTDSLLKWVYSTLNATKKHDNWFIVCHPTSGTALNFITNKIS